MLAMLFHSYTSLIGHLFDRREKTVKLSLRLLRNSTNTLATIFHSYTSLVGQTIVLYIEM